MLVGGIMKRILVLLSMLIIQSCASTPDDSIKFAEKTGKRCNAIATLSSVGFNIIPPVASMLAKSMLKKKAKELNVNTIVIDKQSGLFQVEMEATGYRCY
jgi:PBP1b-binding outer membrane lipoprotein LpoB